MHLGVQVLIPAAVLLYKLVAVVNKWRVMLLSLALAAILSPAVPFVFHHCSCYKDSSLWPRLEFAEVNCAFKCLHRKRKHCLQAVYKSAKLAQVLEFYPHDWHQVTEMHVLCSAVPPLHNQLWMVWHLELTYLKPLNANRVTMKRAAATLQPQSWILLL